MQRNLSQQFSSLAPFLPKVNRITLPLYSIMRILLYICGMTSIYKTPLAYISSFRDDAFPMAKICNCQENRQQYILSSCQPNRMVLYNCNRPILCRIPSFYCYVSFQIVWRTTMLANLSKYAFSMWPFRNVHASRFVWGVLQLCILTCTLTWPMCKRLETDIQAYQGETKNTHSMNE